jgi:hypothetical protein
MFYVFIPGAKEDPQRFQEFPEALSYAKTASLMFGSPFTVSNREGEVMSLVFQGKAKRVLTADEMA